MFEHDKSCPVCPSSMHVDSIPALLSCPTLIAEMKQNGSEDINIKHDHIFSNELTTQRAATVYFRKLLQVREELMSRQETPVDTTNTGPLHYI